MLATQEIRIWVRFTLELSDSPKAEVPGGADNKIELGEAVVDRVLLQGDMRRSATIRQHLRWQLRGRAN